jgi:hypothetical protein
MAVCVIGSVIAWRSRHVEPRPSDVVAIAAPPMNDAPALPPTPAPAPMPPTTGDTIATTAPEAEIANARESEKAQESESRNLRESDRRELDRREAEKARESEKARASVKATRDNERATASESASGLDVSRASNRSIDPVASELHQAERAFARKHDAERTPLPEARDLAKAHFDDPHALKGWATAAYRAGAMREARRAADAWALHDGTVEPRLFLATVLDATGHRADARAVLEEWLQIHPDSSDARRMHARLGAPLPPAEGSHKSLANR